MDQKKLTLVECIAVPLFVGLTAGLLSGGGMEVFAQLDKPPLSPPGWLFPVVWTILYILMGIASWLVLTSEAKREDIVEALIIYGASLVVNFIWPLLFFRLNWYLFAFAWLILLWVLILKTIRLFAPISKEVALLMVPYLVWVTFAGYLNLGIAVLN